MAAQPVDEALTKVRRRRRRVDARRAAPSRRRWTRAGRPQGVAAGPLSDPPRACNRQQPSRPGRRRARDAAAPETQTASGIAAGVAVIRGALKTMPATPGVYRMLDRKGDALYVGKARNLKSRVQNYTHPAGLSNRLRRMVAETAAMEIVVDPHRGRGAAARMQPDQAADAALQRAAARRQIVSADPSDRRSRLSAADQASRRARQGRQLFRPVRLGRRGQPHADHAAEGVSAALVQRQRLRQPHPAVPAVPDQALQRALRRAHRPRGLRRR